MDLLDSLTNKQDAENFQHYRVKRSKGLPHEFYTKYVKTDDTKEGRPVYICKDYIKIRTDEVNCIDTLATEEHKQMYPESWEFYTKNKEPNVEGTLLTECNFMPMTEALSYRDMGILTVEQIVSQRDNPSVDNKLIDIAESYMRASKIEGGMHYLLEIIKKQQAQIQVLERKLDDSKDNN